MITSMLAGLVWELVAQLSIDLHWGGLAGFHMRQSQTFTAKMVPAILMKVF